jgi:hypothetical protein
MEQPGGPAGAAAGGDRAAAGGAPGAPAGRVTGEEEESPACSPLRLRPISRSIHIIVVAQSSESTSIHVPRVQQRLSPRRNWVPHPLSRKRACTHSPSNQRRGEHTRLRVRGWGSPNSDDWRKASFLLCGFWSLSGSAVAIPMLPRFYYKSACTLSLRKRGYLQYCE